MAHETQPGDGRTDAELLARFERWWSWEGVGTSPAYGQDQDECNYNLTRTAWLNGAYVAQELSGTRPLPTDEVAALSARVSVLAALTELLSDLVMAVNPWAPDNGGVFPDVNGRNWFDYRNDLARACIEHGHTANVKQERGDTTQEAVQVEFKRLWDGRKEEADSLSARVAELEEELAGYRHPGGVIVGHSVEGGGWGVFEQTSPGEYMRIAGPFPTRDEAEAEMRGLPKPAPGAEGGDK